MGTNITSAAGHKNFGLGHKVFLQGQQINLSTSFSFAPNLNALNAAIPNSNFSCSIIDFAGNVQSLQPP
jgi:hypothetical protein